MVSPSLAGAAPEARPGRIAQLARPAGKPLQTAVSLATAAEYAVPLADLGPQEPAAPGPEPPSARERELVTLLAQGRVNAQIAAGLYISVRAVGSHLDRIRGKTGCRRRADLTRPALTMDLVEPGAERPVPAGHLTRPLPPPGRGWPAPARAPPGCY